MSWTIQALARIMGTANHLPTGETVKTLRAVIAFPTLALACCVPPAPEPAPAPPAPVAAPAAATAPVRTIAPTDNWLDQPQTPGDWSYTDGTGLSYATFGEPGQASRFGIECVKPSRTIRLVRGAQASATAPMRIRTETTNRLLTAQPSPDGRPLLFAALPATDDLLEAMAFTKGRFAVETGDLSTLYVPAWPEVTRVIEDCR